MLSDIAGNTTFNLTTGELTARNFTLLASHIGQKIQNQYVYSSTAFGNDISLDWTARDALAELYYDSNDSNVLTSISTFLNTYNTTTSILTAKTGYQRIIGTGLNKTSVITSGAPTSGYVYCERFSTGSIRLAGREVGANISQFEISASTGYASIGASSGITGGSRFFASAGVAKMVSGYDGEDRVALGVESSGHFYVYCYNLTSTAMLYIRLTSSGALSYARIMGQNISLSGSSSKRYKHDIAELGSDLDPHKLLELKPKQFVFNADHPLQYQDMAGQTLPGFIAEEVAEIYPSAVIHDNETGEIENWDERRIIPGMLALIQEQAEKIEQLEARIARLEKLLEVQL